MYEVTTSLAVHAFVAVTDARVYDAAGSRLRYEASCVLLASTFVVSVTPLSAIASADAAWGGVLAPRAPKGSGSGS